MGHVVEQHAELQELRCGNTRTSERRCVNAAEVTAADAKSGCTRHGRRSGRSRHRRRVVHTITETATVVVARCARPFSRHPRPRPTARPAGCRWDRNRGAGAHGQRQARHPAPLPTSCGGVTRSAIHTRPQTPRFPAAVRATFGWMDKCSFECRDRLSIFRRGRLPRASCWLLACHGKLPFVAVRTYYI